MFSIRPIQSNTLCIVNKTPLSTVNIDLGKTTALIILLKNLLSKLPQMLTSDRVLPRTCYSTYLLSIST